jgi:hypothetical protein
MSRVPMLHVPWARTRMAGLPHILADSAIATPDLEALGLPHAASAPPEGYRAQAELERMLGERIGAPGGRVMIAAGASEANAIVFAALLAPGDEVLAEIPGYEPHRVVPALFGATVRGFDRPLEGPRGALAAAVERSLGPRTRLVVLSDLHNPGGGALNEDDLAALEALAARRDLRLLCDETFRDAGDRPPATVAARSDRWVTTGSLTKSYGLGGLRIGWVAGDPGALTACEEVHDALSAQPSLLSVALARALVPHLDRLRARTHEILAANHGVFERFAARNARFAGPAVHGTTTWREFAGEDEGDRFCEFASGRFGVALARGGFFGRPRGLRIALGNEPLLFQAAMDALERAAAAFPWSAPADARAPRLTPSRGGTR